MKLSQIAAKPKLIVFSLDDEATVKEYGEPVKFIPGTASHLISL
jgi:hypothetical protein